MLRAVVEGIHHQLRDGLLFQVQRSTIGGVEVSVHPDKGLSHVLFVWRRVERVWQAPVEMPGDKQALAFHPYVGKSREESPRKKKKAEMNLGSTGLTACATIK
jgi:hypothetical protein